MATRRGGGATHVLRHPALRTDLDCPVGVALMVRDDKMTLAWQATQQQSVHPI